MKHSFIKVSLLNLLLAAAIPSMSKDLNPEPIQSGFPAKGEHINTRLDRLGSQMDQDLDQLVKILITD